MDTMADQESDRSPGFSNIHEVRVLWADTDPAGITFYGNYFKWMDEAVYYLFRKAGLRWEDWPIAGVLGIPIITAHGDFSNPTKFGDLLKIESFVSEWGRSSFTVFHRFRCDGNVVAEAYEKRVWCTGDRADPSTIKSAPVPEEVRKALGG